MNIAPRPTLVANILGGYLIGIAMAVFLANPALVRWQSSFRAEDSLPS